jgi:ATP-binding cassette subfamily D (ALD) long-chain fatty acid import protein
MAPFSALRLSKANNERLASAIQTYSKHRPLVQRVLNISYVLYVLGATYYGLSQKQSSSGPSKKSRRKGKDDGGKQERVAVSAVFTTPLAAQLTRSQGGCRFL